MAEALAYRGIATLRFDWFGTGDSAGGDINNGEHNDLGHSWPANVRDAVRFMKRACGLERISVIGFRAGALLAVEGLIGEEIENLVLWAPVVSGRAFTRELILLDSAASSAAPSASVAVPKRNLEAGGFCYSTDTIAGLAALNILKRPLRCRNALFVARDDLPVDRNLHNWLISNGVATEVRTLPGVKEMLVEPHFTQVPHESIASISDWLVERIDESSAFLPAFESEAIGATSMELHVGPCEGVSRALAGETPAPQVVETIWQSGQSHNLAGVLSGPLGNETRLPLVVLLNAGAAYRIGVSRLNVLLARRLAGLGFQSLRFDLRGLGDSPTGPFGRENDTYPASGFADMAHVLDAARRELGRDRCVFIGLCSGAYFAFQAAAQFSNPMLVESIMINPLTYFWRDGMTIDDPELREALESHWRFSRKLDVHRLWKFLSGRSRVGYLGAARDVIARLAGRWNRWAIGQVANHRDGSAKPCGTDATCGHPLGNDLPRDMMRAARAERKLTLFVAETDPGLLLMNSQAPRQVKQLSRQGVLSVARIANADHTFSRSLERDALIDRIASHLTRRYS